MARIEKNEMRKTKIGAALTMLIVTVVAYTCIKLIGELVGEVTAQELYASAFDEHVDSTGQIRLPKDFQNSWVFLGSWAIDGSQTNQTGAVGFHNVYTQPGVVDYFKLNGNFPDGAMLIKELLASETGEMTTGTVSHATEVQGWFVMVKDHVGRFETNPLWGDGWGWALFNADDPENTVTTDYRQDCLTCHVPAREDDWIYLSGYPHLNL